MQLFAFTAFLSAFLLFWVQPLLGHFILPWFGGSPSVWTVCLLFFQTMLVAGYFYSHLLQKKWMLGKNLWVHGCLLLVSCLLLPVIPETSWRPTGGGDPSGRILGLLFVTVGLPYILLSATAPLLHSWHARRSGDAGGYRLYAWSNGGALTALVLYPTLLAPNFGRILQSQIWAFAFGILALALIRCGWLARSRSDHHQSDIMPEWSPPPGAGDRVLWIVLPMLGTLLLTSITQIISQDISVVPLLWVLPLALYLLSHILAFTHGRFYPKNVGRWLSCFASGALVYALDREHKAGVLEQLLLFNGGLFLLCWMLHGELARLKPEGRYVSSFYLSLAVGGALGGAFVGIIAPLLFSSYVEVHIGLVCSAVALLILVWRDADGPLHQGRKLWAWGLLGLLCIAMTWKLASDVQGRHKKTLFVSRSFFGALQVKTYALRSKPDDRIRHLLDGRISHGFQYLDPEKRNLPTAYFVEESGVGLAMLYRPDDEGRNFGVIGLGVGTLASYTDPGDSISFYELNPDVVEVSKRYFSYLNDAGGVVDVHVGDGRLALERAPYQGFDVLVLDAFSSDAVPTHLLTKEAMKIYWRHLDPEGILAINVTNRHINLLPVIQGHALTHQIPAVFVRHRSKSPMGSYVSHWILMSANEDFLAWPPIAMNTSKPPVGHQGPVFWTDDHAPVFPLLFD
jgi:hypothetical protein